MTATKPEPPKSYRWWLLNCALGVIPQARDWEGFWTALIEILRITGWGAARILARIALLLTFPVSLPIFAYKARQWEARQNKRIAEWRDKDY